MTMDDHHSGGCQCGAIATELVGGFGKAGICHCTCAKKAFRRFGAAH